MFGCGNEINLTKQQAMDLMSAKQSIREKTRVDKGKTLYINVDDEGECSISDSFDRSASAYAYKNGNEIALPELTEKSLGGGKLKINKRKVINNQTLENDNLDTTMKSTSDSAIQKKAVKKAPVKKSVAKKSASAKKSAPSKKANGLPEGVKMKITVKKAIELAKAGAAIYRASNGSPFGKYYLDKVGNKDREMELIVRK